MELATKQVKLDEINVWEHKLEDLQHKLSREEKQEFPIENTLNDSQHKDSIMKDEDMETPNEFKQLQAQQHQPTTQTNQRSP